LPPSVKMFYGIQDDPNTNANGQAFTLDISKPFGPNWAVFILPFIEQDNLYKQANVASYPGSVALAAWKPGIDPSTVGADSSWRGIRGQVIKTYLCPSDYNNSTFYEDLSGVDCPPETGWARGNYACNSGFTDFDHTVGGNDALGNKPFGGPGDPTS